MSLDFLIDDMKNKLFHKGSVYLYTLPTNPKIFVIKNDEECIDKYHILKTFEIRFGYALFIVRICTFCYYGEVEVFPPNENRLVIEN